MRQYMDIAVIYTLENGCVALLKNGESIIWSKTLVQSLNELPADDYFLINRSNIVGRSIIEGYELGKSRRLKLILKLPLTNHQVFMVSQRKVVAFKRWYKRILNCY